MKQYCLATALLTVLVCFSTAAVAQSVTLSGVTDIGVRRIKNGDVTQNLVNSDGNTPSRLVFAGLEDLGGGLKASFWLESGIAIDTGSQALPGKFWNRRSTVSLSGRFGELRLGRDYTPTFNGYVLYDPFYTTGVGASFNVLAGPGLSNGSGAATTVRADNAVQYWTPPTLGGFYAQVMAAPSEGAAGNNYRGLKSGYLDGPVDVSAAYGRTDVATGRYDIWTVGAAYAFKPLKVSVFSLNTSFNARMERALLIGTTIPVDLGEIRASYIRKRASGAGTDGNDDWQFALGYVYSLSKRTALYATGSVLRNQGKSASVVSIGSTVVPGQGSTGFDAGIRHIF